MADEKQAGPGFGGNSAILFLIAAASAVYMGWHKPPLVSTRPAGPDYQTHEIVGVQDVDARLWQDPFDAVMRDVEGGGRKPIASEQHHSTTDLQLLLADHPTLALGVTLPGTPYPEAVETRRRLRYAVLSALHVADFVPEDEKRIGYWRTRDDPKDGRKPKSMAVSDRSSSQVPQIIPFEQFDSINPPAGPKKRIVVFWLDEDFLTEGRQPIGRFEQLMFMLLQPLPRLPSCPNVKFALLGPQDSTTLASMATEINQEGLSKSQLRLKFATDRCRNSAERANSGVFSIYNFGATVEDQKLLRATGSSGTSLRDLQEHFLKKGIRYHRTISTDRDLAKELVQELVRRDVDLGRSLPLPHSPDNAIAIHPDHIALISEWDTVYGRNLVETVSAAFAKTGDQKRVAARPEWIEAYSYLRGLDGRVPDRRTPKQQPQASNSEGAEQKPDNHPNATPDTASKFESAEGQSQYDYLRRLAEVIHLRDDELRRNGERIAAIGVLGSDVYDKLLILQALRPELPNALYFTRDLDALLLPQEKTRYTRNLLVASGFGLTLDSDLQADIPPFRNTYQSSIFLATRLAVQNEWSDSRPDAASKADTALKCWSMRPVLFQIGRSAPRALPSVFKDSAPGGNGDNCPKQSGSLVDITDRRSVQPSVAELSPELGWWGRLGIGLLLAALAITALLGSHTVRRACFPHSGATPSSAGFVQPRFSRLILMFAGVLAVSVGLSLAWPLIGPFLTENGFGEPVALFEGISVWPTIVLRTLGTGLSLWLICCTLQSLEKNKRETAKEFGLDSLTVTLREQRFKLHQQWETHLHRSTGSSQGQQRRIERALATIVSLLWFPPKIVGDATSIGFGQRRKVEFKDLSGGFSLSRSARSIRAGAGLIAMVLIWSLILVPNLGQPNAPARGDLARGIYKWVTFADVLATLFLIFLVADATLYLRAFIKRLTAVSTIWPSETVIKFERKLNVQSSDLSDWIDLQFLTSRTRCITRLIYFPFVALAVLIVSRSQLFDDFSMPQTLIVAQVISVTVILGSVLALRSAAEKARAVACEHLAAKVIAAKGSNEKTASQLEMMLDQVKELKDGAFAPLSSQPVVKAVLLPLLSYGATLLAHLYAVPGV